MSNTHELEANLANYKLQLSQVEAALTADQENEELKKLKGDLEEVCEGVTSPILTNHRPAHNFQISPLVLVQ